MMLNCLIRKDGHLNKEHRLMLNAKRCQMHTPLKPNVAGKRNGTKTSRYRKDNAIPSNQDVDHTIDLQLGGQDNVINMNGLDKSVNRSLGKQINILIKNLHEGTVLGKFTMK